MQKIIYCRILSSDSGEIDLTVVNLMLEKGWTVVSVTAQYVSRAGESSYKKESYGGAIIVIENTNMPTTL